MDHSKRTLSLLSRLTETNEEVLSKQVGKVEVSISINRAAAALEQAQLSFTFSVNLLARLFPLISSLKISVPANSFLTAPIPRWKNDFIDGHINKFLNALQTPISWELIDDNLPLETPCVRLSVDSDNGNISNHVYIGSNGWELSISPSQVQDFGTFVNPIGAYAAACFGVAEICKHILAPLFKGNKKVPLQPLQSDFRFSTFTYQHLPDQPNPELPNVRLDGLTVVGAGAGGGAALFTLASLKSLAGKILVIEPDEIAEHNLNRYVFADSSDVREQRKKVDIVGETFLVHEGVSLQLFPLPFDKALTSLPTEAFRHVISAVHTRAARKAIQYETPLVLWDAAASETGEFYIWRQILGVTNCMMCKHSADRDEDPEMLQAKEFHRHFGLSESNWYEKIKNNSVFTDSDIEYLVSTSDLERDSSIDFPVVGQRFSDWQAEHCGRLNFSEADEEIPIPFAPVLAGVLLAGEVIKEGYFHENVLNSHYWNTLLGSFMKFNQPVRRHAKPDCTFCRDKAYLDQYSRRWGKAVISP